MVRTVLNGCALVKFSATDIDAAMLRANQAVRLGLRAASRNPELAFGKALLDQAGNLMALLPLVLGGLLVAQAVSWRGLGGAVRAVRVLQWPMAGAMACALIVTFVAGMLFWSGALPLLAADAEMDARPPPGNFGLLASRGFARVLSAGALGYALSLFFGLACTAALFGALPAFAARRSVLLLAGVAAVAAVAIVGGIVIDLLTRLVLVRAAAFGDGATAAFAHAASLMGARLGACLAIAFAFLLLELVVATAAGTITGVISSSAFFDPDAELLALAPRIAVGLAAAAVFAWLEVGRQGALAALVADAEGLIQPPAEAELVVEALPVEE
jgi:hypothetical protein